MRGLVIRGCVIIIIESRSAIVSSYVSYWAGKQYKENIKQMCNLVVTKGLFPTNPHNDRGLLNVFTGQQATHEQTSDMLSFYQIGENAFQNYVKYHILQTSSVKAPLRQHKLITMATTKVHKTHSTHKEREAKQVITCLR